MFVRVSGPGGSGASLAGFLAVQLGTLPSQEAPAWEAARSWSVVAGSLSPLSLVPEFLSLRGLESGSLLALVALKPLSMLKPGPVWPLVLREGFGGAVDYLATREPGAPAGTRQNRFCRGEV